MKKSNLLFYFAFLGIFISSCSDDEGAPQEPKGDYENGYFVINEGPFQNGSGTITFVEDGGPVSQNIYKTVNEEDLGNIVNSMYIDGDKAYIVVNNSNKVVVANINTMEKEAEITGNDIVNPRFFVANDGKGYISNWGDPLNTEDDFITVISLESNAVLGKIPVGEGPEKMIIASDKLYVCLQGGFGSNNKVVVINTSNDSVEANLIVGDVPNSIVADSDGDLWVLCGGNPSWTGAETPGFLYKIDPSSSELSFKQFENTEHPSLLSQELDNLYFVLDGKVFRMGSEDVELPTDALEGLDGFYYSITVEDGFLYATDAGDYVSGGKLKVFNTVSGDLLQTITIGIISGQVVFP